MRFRQRLIYACLVSPESATALKEQRNAFEGRPADAGVAHARGSCCLLIGHGGDAWAFHAATPWAGRGGEQSPCGDAAFHDNELALSERAARAHGESPDPSPLERRSE